jgi:hypothetical protein
VGAELARRGLRAPLVVCGSLHRQHDTAELLMKAAGLGGTPARDRAVEVTGAVVHHFVERPAAVPDLHDGGQGQRGVVRLHVDAVEVAGG